MSLPISLAFVDGNANGQTTQKIPTVTVPSTVLPETLPTVQTVNQKTQGNQPIDLASAIIQLYDPSAVAPVARTSGISGTAGISQPRLSYAQAISETVNANAFLPPDLITDNPVIVLPSTRNNGWWDISASASAAIDYDSNITRTSHDSQSQADSYEHTEAGANFRLGTASSPLALQGYYSYTADLFNRFTGFDTYTHQVNFQGRIGRSSAIFIPYFLGSFRSVSNPAAVDSGRESYTFLAEGLRGQEQIDPNITHTFDFSHTSVAYFQRTNSNFQIWRLYQELDDRSLLGGAATNSTSILNDMTVFPWLDLKETSPTAGVEVNEISGGLGGSLNLARQMTVRGRLGWGDVDSTSRSIQNGSFNGLRYDAEWIYTPFRELRLSLNYQRALSFTPTTVGRDANILDFTLSSPLDIGAHFVLTPALEIYHSDSNDYQDPEHSTFPQPSVQLSYQLNDHAAFFMKTQYRTTDDTRFGATTDVKVLQSSVGLTVAF